MQVATTHSTALTAAIRSTTHAPHLSPRYVQIPTEAVVDLMAGEGFVVAEIKSDRTRRRDPQWARHQIDFRLPNAPVMRDGIAPRFLFTNSHNGTARAQFALGVFRQVCSNGMVVGSAWARERVVHVGDNAKAIIDRIRALAANTTPLFRQIDQWTKRELTVSQQLDLAKGAAALRFGDAERFGAEQLLRVRRPEDEGADLWRVFNRIQENATQGGLTGRAATGRPVASRALTAIHQGNNFNAQLWSLAETFA